MIEPILYILCFYFLQYYRYEMNINTFYISTSRRVYVEYSPYERILCQCNACNVGDCV